MPITRSFTNAYEIQDYTPELKLIPNQWSLITSMGIFSEESVATNSIIVESHEGTLSVIPDQRRGKRNQVNSDETRISRALQLVHHPLDDYISPEDIQGKRAYGSADEAETLDAVMMRKLERIQRSHDATKEAARAAAIVSGTTFAPNGSVVQNYYTEFGVTQTEVDFLLSTSTTDVLGKIETVIAAIQDNLKAGGFGFGVTFLCGANFFQALITHPKVEESYKFYSSTQEPLRNRLTGGGTDARFRQFVFGGATFIEYRGSFTGYGALVPTDEAYAFPVGIPDMFVTYYGPARKLSLVNTLGESAYAWTYREPTDTAIMIESEHNALHLNRRPAGVVKCNKIS